MSPSFPPRSNQEESKTPVLAKDSPLPFDMTWVSEHTVLQGLPERGARSPSWSVAGGGDLPTPLPGNEVGYRQVSVEIRREVCPYGF